MSTTPSSAEVCAALCEFLSADLEGPGAPIGPTSSITDLGVDSFALMETLVFLEDRFGKRLPLELLTPENTATLDALSRSYAGLFGGNGRK